MFGIDLEGLMALPPTGLFGAAADREVETIRYNALEPDLDSPYTRFTRQLGPLPVSISLRPIAVCALLYRIADRARHVGRSQFQIEPSHEVSRREGKAYQAVGGSLLEPIQSPGGLRGATDDIEGG